MDLTKTVTLHFGMSGIEEGHKEKEDSRKEK